MQVRKSPPASLPMIAATLRTRPEWTCPDGKTSHLICASFRPDRHRLLSAIAGRVGTRQDVCVQPAGRPAPAGPGLLVRVDPASTAQVSANKSELRFPKARVRLDPGQRRCNTSLLQQTPTTCPDR